MSERSFTNKYDDIINLPHHVSRKRPKMLREDRAAQFAPFAALTGHGEAVKEAARLTEQRIELDEYEKEQLRGKLQYLAGCVTSWNAAARAPGERPTVTVTYFKPDLLKDGGEYVTASGPVKKIDLYTRHLVMADGTEIPVDELIAVDGEPFGDEFGAGD